MVQQRSLVAIPHDSSLLVLVVRLTERGKKLTGAHLTKKSKLVCPFQEVQELKGENVCHLGEKYENGEHTGRHRGV